MPTRSPSLAVLAALVAVIPAFATLAAAQSAPPEASAMPAAQAPAPAAQAPAPAATPLVIPVPGHGSLALDVPSGWRFEVVQPPNRLPPSLELTPRGDERGGRVRLIAVWSPDGRDVSSPEAIRSAAEYSAKKAKVPIESIKPIDGIGGWHVTVRDPPGPAEDREGYEYVTHANSAVGKLQVVATFLADSEDSPARQAGLALMRSIRGVPGQAATLPVALTPASGAWDLRFDVPADFAVTPSQRGKDDGSVVLQAGTAEGWTVTASIERDPRGLTPVAHRDELVQEARASVREMAARAKRLEVKLVDLRTWEEPDRALLAHGVTIDGDVAKRSRSVVLVRDGHWIDVTVSHVPPTTGDEATFDAILRSVRFE